MKKLTTILAIITVLSGVAAGSYVWNGESETAWENQKTVAAKDLEVSEISEERTCEWLEQNNQESFSNLCMDVEKNIDWPAVSKIITGVKDSDLSEKWVRVSRLITCVDTNGAPTSITKCDEPQFLRPLLDYVEIEPEGSDDTTEDVSGEAPSCEEAPEKPEECICEEGSKRIDETQQAYCVGGDDTEKVDSGDSSDEWTCSYEPNGDVEGFEPQFDWPGFPIGENTRGSFELNGKRFEYGFTSEPNQPSNCEGFDSPRVTYNVVLKSDEENADLGSGDYRIKLFKKRPGDRGGWEPISTGFASQASATCSGKANRCFAHYQPAEVDVSGMEDGQTMSLGFSVKALDPEQGEDDYVSADEVSEEYVR